MSNPSWPATCSTVIQEGCLEEKATSSLATPLSSAPSLLPTLASLVSLRASSQEKTCWGFFAFGRESNFFFFFFYQPATGPGQGLLAPGVSANSEKASGVMVTGVLDVSL